MGKFQITSKAGAFASAHGTDAADLMAALDAAGVPADQDWANERTTWAFPDGSRISISTTEVLVLPAGSVVYEGRAIDMDAARALMDDELCDEIHGTVDTDQEFLDAYIAAHSAKYGSEWVFG